MNRLYILLTISGLVFLVSGCRNSGTCPPYNGPGLFGAVNGARIAPPGTGTLQYPAQVANLPDPYYGRSPTPATSQPGTQPNPNVNQGWRPTNPTPGTPNPVNYNPNAGSQPTSGSNTIPSNNMVVSSSTSSIQPRVGNAALPSTNPNTNPNPNAAVASTSVTGGMPLNDATRVATAPPTAGNTGIFNRTLEYVARPTPTGYPNQTPNQGQYQYATQPQYVPQPVYAKGTLVASSSTNPGFTRPRPTSYSYQYGNQPGYQNGYTNGYPNGYNGYGQPQNGVVAEGWRQRDVAR